MYVCMHLYTYIFSAADIDNDGTVSLAEFLGNVYAYMYVCVYMCAYVCLYVFMFVFMYVCMYLFLYLFMVVCIYVCMYFELLMSIMTALFHLPSAWLVCIYIYIYIYIYMYLCSCVDTHVCMYVCIYTRTYQLLISNDCTVSPADFLASDTVPIQKIRRWHLSSIKFLESDLYSGFI